MSVGRVALAGLLAKIISDTSAEREEGSENVGDWSRSFDVLEARIVVRVLAVIAEGESDSRSREAQLNAIAEIFDPQSMSIHDIAPVFEIPQETLDPSEREYVAQLRGYLD